MKKMSALDLIENLKSVGLEDPVMWVEMCEWFFFNLPSPSLLWERKLETQEVLDKYLTCIQKYGWRNDAMWALISSLNVSDLTNLYIDREVIKRCMKIICCRFLFIGLEEHKFLYTLESDPLFISENEGSSRGIHYERFVEELDSTFIINTDGSIRVKLDLVKVKIFSKHLYGIRGNYLYKLHRKSFQVLQVFSLLQVLEEYSVSLDEEVAAIYSENFLFIYSLKDGSILSSMSLPMNGVTWMKYTDSYLFLFSSNRNALILLSLPDHYKVWWTSCSEAPILSRSGKRMLISGNLFDVKTKELVVPLFFPSPVAFGGNDDKIYWAEGGTLKMYNVSNNTRITVFKLGHEIKTLELSSIQMVRRFPKLFSRLMEKI